MVRYTVPVADYHVRAARGKLKTPDGQAVFTVNSFGRNSDVDAAANEDIIDAGGTLNLISTAGVATVVSTSANDDMGGSGAEKIRIYGLDENYDMQDELVELNGTSNVTTTGKWSFIHKMIVEQSANGANTSFNAGNITATVDGNVVAQINAGNNQTFMAAFMVPRNHEAFMYKFYTYIHDASSNAAPNMFIYRKPDSQPYQKEFSSSLRLNTTYSTTINVVHDFLPPKKFTEKTIIKIVADVDVDDCDISAGFDLVIIPDDYDQG